jgi:exodeoxyribonuclease V alpha subunit
MVDLPMMTRVLRALPVTARLVLIGDANQLPSIAVGSVLSDLAPLPHRGYSAGAAETIERLCGYRVPVMDDGADNTDFVTLLHKSHRFDGSGGIGRLAESVIELAASGSWQLLQAAASLHEAGGADSQLSFVRPEQVATWLEQAVAEHYAPLARCTDLAEAFTRLAAFRVLVPTRVGPMGVDALNLSIETWLARGSAATRPGRDYHGRPIMVTRNQPALGVFNGDVGLVWRNGMGNLEACFDLDSGTRRINLALLPAVEPVYAMTIHKTQGSEFGKVALLLSERAGRLLSSELIYTGITRAKRHCVISASEAVWREALAARVARWSGLRQRVIAQ